MLKTPTNKNLNEDHLLIRKELFLKLDMHSGKKVIALTAGAGYGKTTLISSYIHYNKIPHIWYDLHAPSTTLDELLTFVLTNLIERSNKNIESLPVPAKLNFVKKLLLKLEDEYLWIIIDGSEFLELDKEHMAMLLSLIHILPRNISFVFLGKRLPSHLTLGKWKMQGKLLSITQEDLSFKEKDIHELFHYVYQISLSDFEIGRTMHETEGWPAGIALFREAVKDLPQIQRAQFWDKSREGNDVYQYLINEVIAVLPNHLRHFLYYCSLGPTIDKEVLKYLLPELSIFDALRELEDTEIIISYNSRGTPRLHELFRRYLYKEAKEELGEETIQSLHYQLSQIYLKKYQFFEAFSQSLAAGDKQMTAEIMNVMVDRYEPEHFLQLIDGWLESVSPSLDLSKTSLFLFRCIPIQLLERLIEPLQVILKKNKSKNPYARLNIYHRLATIYFYTGDIKNAINNFLQSLDLAKQINNRSMIALNTSMLSQMYRFMYDVEKAISLAKEALLVAEREGHKEAQMHALWNLSEAMLDIDELEIARRFALEAVDIGQSCDDAAVIYPLCTVSKYYRKKQQFNEAFHWVDKAIKLAEKFQIQTDLGWVYHKLALCYKEMGQFENAIDFIKRSEYLFQAFHNQRCNIQIDLAKILAHLQKNDEAEKVLKEVRKTVDHFQYDWIKVPFNFKSVNNNEKLTLKLLGNFEIRLGNKPIKITRKASRRLLFLLASYYERRWSKEEIIGKLFPDEIEEAASNHFFVSLSQLRKELEPDLKKGKQSSYIEFNGSHYRFIYENVDFDLKSFTDCLDQQKTETISFENVIQLYKGDLLEEYPYEEFLEEKRVELKNSYLNLLNLMILHNKREGKHDQLNHIYEILIQVDPYNEHSYFAYIEHLVNGGLKLKAKQVGRQAVEFFERELGVSIKKEFEDLIKETIS